jgi:hypothetical protein
MAENRNFLATFNESLQYLLLKVCETFLGGIHVKAELWPCINQGLM